MRSPFVGGVPPILDPYEKLRQNDVTGFPDAMEAVIEHCNTRLVELDSEPTFGYSIALGVQLLLLKQAALECRQQYDKTPAMNEGILIESWKSHWNIFAVQIGEALESWDYSRLAI